MSKPRGQKGSPSGRDRGQRAEHRDVVAHSASVSQAGYEQLAPGVYFGPFPEADAPPTETVQSPATPEELFAAEVRHHTHQRGELCDDERTERSLRWLRTTPGVLDALAKQLVSAEAADQVAAAVALTHSGLAGMVVLLDAARGDSVPARRAAFAALPLLAHRTDDIISILTDALSDPDDSIRTEAVQALGFLRARSVDALPSLLVAKSKEGHSWLGHYISCAISWIVPSAIDTLGEALRHPDEGVRANAARHYPDAISMSRKSVAMLASTVTSDPSDAARMSALRALEQIGLRAGEALACVMDALAKAQDSQLDVATRARSVFVQERVRDTVGGLARVPRGSLPITPRATKKASLKSVRTESQELSLLALLNALVAWQDEPISRRKLPDSMRLTKERVALGLKETTSDGTVGYQLAFLARLCGEESILQITNKRQSSEFRPGVKKKLVALREQLMPYILAGAKQREIHASMFNFARKP